MDEKVLLKDLLVNKQRITKIAEAIHKVDSHFDKAGFIKNTIEKFPQLELKQRVSWTTKNLKQFLLEDYTQAVTILLKTLPVKIDNEYADFTYASYTDFVARYGCTKTDVAFSLQALKKMTPLYTAEDAIRYFINAFPEQTMSELLTWSKDPDYRVRRLASEGTRPRLPWSQKITISPKEALPILNNLFFDNSRFVTRSVANHLNDISKIDPDLAITTLKRWQESEKQNPKEMEYIINQALRTLIKSGDARAITFLNLSTDPQVTISAFKVDDLIVIGDYLEFSFMLQAKQDELLLIDYCLSFQNKAGNGSNKKVFKLKKIALKKEQQVLITKKHAMKHFSTRKLYPGAHAVTIQINGKKVFEKSFELAAKR